MFFNCSNQARNDQTSIDDRPVDVRWIIGRCHQSSREFVLYCWSNIVFFLGTAVWLNVCALCRLVLPAGCISGDAGSFTSSCFPRERGTHYDGVVVGWLQTLCGAQTAVRSATPNKLRKASATINEAELRQRFKRHTVVKPVTWIHSDRITTFLEFL